jgi:transposase
MGNLSTHVGLHVHKHMIGVSIADDGRAGEIRHYGTIPSDLRSVDALIRT